MKQIIINIHPANLSAEVRIVNNDGVMFSGGVFDDTKNVVRAVREALDMVAQYNFQHCSTCHEWMTDSWREEHTSGLCPACWSELMQTR